MRILYHHRTRGRHVEGVHIRGVVNALRGLGHDVAILSFPGADPEHEPAPQAQAAAVPGRLARLVSRMPGVLFECMELAYNAVSFVRVRAAIARQRPALIYERYSLFLWVTVWLARRRGIPVVLEINDSALVERVRPLWMKALARRIERWNFTHATGLVFISGYFRDKATAAYGAIAPSVISPNAADVARFDAGRFDRDALRGARGMAGCVVCGHIGVFAYWHGLEAFVEAVAPRLREAPNLTLLLVGDGKTLPDVRARVEELGLSDRVLLPGRVAHEDIPGWIACMDYAVLPNSNRYGSPMKLFELMAMGVAVVAADYEPVAEVIADGATGWLFPHGDQRACVDKVIAMATQGEERARVGAAAAAYIRRERQWRNNAEALLTLIPEGAG